MRVASISIVCAWGLLLVDNASAQAPPGVQPYDGIQAGLDAFRIAEEQRQASVALQLNQNEAQRAWAGLPSARGSAIYYGFPAPTPLANLDYAYAYGRGHLGIGLGAARYGVFEPWPFIHGDIDGGVYAAPIRQPIGQWQGQTGPRRWESHPIYDPPLADYRPLPDVYVPGPAVAVPPGVNLPAPNPGRRGPREY